MAIVRCPACRRRYSSVGGNCTHCGAAPDEAARSRRKKHAGVGPNTHYLIAMLAAMGGALWYFSAVSAGRDPTYAGYLIGVGLVWYVGARIWGAMRR
ncbi:MAG: hypothetical protein HKN49_14205 [Gammaproteobacteria bacterium]|nr:hypothetical protein [Gammaproteobacteria bacterium]